VSRALPLDQIIRIASFRCELRAFLRHSEQVARRWELTPQRYLLLLTIKGAPDWSEHLTVSEIAERLALSLNTVTGLCDRAEEAGLVRREDSPSDLRLVYLRLTEEGDRRLRGALLETERYRDELVHAFSGLSESFRVATRP
jgi:DNA-binding MarR family transcriptional regulator